MVPVLYLQAVYSSTPEVMCHMACLRAPSPQPCRRASNHVHHDGGHLAAVGAYLTTAHHHQQDARALHGKVRCAASRATEPRKRPLNGVLAPVRAGQSGARRPSPCLDPGARTLCRGMHCCRSGAWHCFCTPRPDATARLTRACNYRPRAHWPGHGARSPSPRTWAQPCQCAHKRHRTPLVFCGRRYLAIHGHSLLFRITPRG